MIKEDNKLKKKSLSRNMSSYMLGTSKRITNGFFYIVNIFISIKKVFKNHSLKCRTHEKLILMYNLNKIGLYISVNNKFSFFFQNKLK